MNAPDGHAPCDWRGCAREAWFAREMSLRPPGFDTNVDATIRLCKPHLIAISEQCRACLGIGAMNCPGNCVGGWTARPGAVLALDWVKILEALGEGGLLRSDA